MRHHAHSIDFEGVALYWLDVAPQALRRVKQRIERRGGIPAGQIYQRSNLVRVFYRVWDKDIDQATIAWSERV